MLDVPVWLVALILACAAPLGAAALQSLLSNPDAIASLARDPQKLRALLAQYPQLAAILQQRMGGGR